MSEIRLELANFLERAFPGVTIQTIASDASVRRFYRVFTRGGSRYVVMDHGGPFDGETDDARMARVFGAAGLRVAEVLDSCGNIGCLLLEDLGDQMLETAVSSDDGQLRPGARGPIEQAVRLAAQVSQRGSVALARSERREGPSLNAGRLRFEMDYFLEHYVKGLLHRTAIPDQLRGELHDLAERAASTPKQVMCHRDFHSRNLMVLPDGHLAMVDIQDARWGPDSYDLASLLRDAYIEIEEDWIAPMIAVYLSCLEEPPAAGPFHERFHMVATQRMIKALGTFGYQSCVLGRSCYLSAIPRTLARLERTLPQFQGTQPLHRLLKEAGVLGGETGETGTELLSAQRRK